jgi:hypothetical protein
MRSPERGAIWAAVALVLTGAVFAALAAWSLVARSTIPAELDGTVTAIELRHEKHPGVDDVWMVAVDEDGLRHVDVEVAALLSEGDRLRKEAWATTLVVEGEPHAVSLSDDARAMLVLAPALVVLIGALTLFSSRRAEEFRRGPMAPASDPGTTRRVA